MGNDRLRGRSVSVLVQNRPIVGQGPTEEGSPKSDYTINAGRIVPTFSSEELGRTPAKPRGVLIIAVKIESPFLPK